MKTIEIKNLQTPEIQELTDSELSGVVGGAVLPLSKNDELFLNGVLGLGSYSGQFTFKSKEEAELAFGIKRA